MKPIIQFNVKVPINIFPEDDGFVSYCAALDVSSQGDTPEEAKTNLIEAITGFIITCYEKGTLSQVLKDCGFVPVSVSDIRDTSPDSDVIDVPLPFMLSEGIIKECHT